MEEALVTLKVHPRKKQPGENGKKLFGKGQNDEINWGGKRVEGERKATP